MATALNFCSECGCRLDRNAPCQRGEALVCANGHLNFPPGPKILVACFVSCGERLLWMRRGNEPRRGYWAIPAGFMEEGETLREAAARELREETCVALPPDRFQPYMIGSISYISEVYAGFRATVPDMACGCGAEATEVGFFSRDELDWSQVAYPSANVAIRQAYTDAEAGRFGVYHGLFTDDVSRLDPVIAPR